MAETTIMQEKVFVNPDHSIQVLYQLSELWRDKKLCDATIEVGPVKVYVHRLVLLAACPYLLSIGGCQDVSILEVKLPLSVGLEGLNVFLTYLYDGVLNLSTNNLLSVEKISNIMKVVGIRKFCEEFREMDQSVRNSVGPPEVVSSEHSVRVKENSVQIIFGESSSDLKQDIVQENESESDCKRRKMNVESLSPILQQSSTVARKKETPKRKIKLKISKSPKGIRSSCTEVKQQESDELSNVSIKQEPDNYSDDGDNESFDDAVQTDFVRQAPYNTQALASSDEEDETSHTSGVQEQGHSHVDASRVLQNVVKNMPEVALGLDTAAEIDDDNQPRMFMRLNESPKSSSKKSTKTKHTVSAPSTKNKNQEYSHHSESHSSSIVRGQKKHSNYVHFGPYGTLLEDKEVNKRRHPLNRILRFKCSVCSVYFTYMEEYDEHILRQTQRKLVTNEDLVEEEITLSDDNTFKKKIYRKCCECGKSVFHKGMSRHVKMHRDMPYKCNSCSQFFMNQDCLDKHNTRFHSEPHICPKCGKTYSTRAGVNEHLRNHHRVGKVHVCEQCGKYFPRLVRLRYHMKKHISQSLSSNNITEPKSIKSCISMDHDYAVGENVLSVEAKS